MKRILTMSLLSLSCVLSAAATEAVTPRVYEELAPGAVRPEGWLKEVLVRQAEGISGKMDELYPEVMGSRNGWLGGDGDQWERGPYWIDGLLPLAWQLDDAALMAKVTYWVEKILSSGAEDGFFGPSTDYPYERGLQRNNSRDWWPRMVVLKILQQYYDATGDGRIIPFLTRYFHYQLATLPEKPLGYWTGWAEWRACDNLQVVLWLYGKTQDPALVELAELLHKQGIDYTSLFLESDALTRFSTMHGVNLAQGMKEPVIYYQLHPEERYVAAVKKALQDLDRYQGFPTGTFSGDELLHGNCPTQGTELCSVVEEMYSLEQMMQITGDMDFTERLEKIAYNALPAQMTPDMTARQYFQQVNQVMVTKQMRNFDINHRDTDLLFGLMTGYPCCTSNLHQGWPKLTRNLWLSTREGGLAALVYAPCRVTAEIDGIRYTLVEETAYPMEETVRIRISTPSRKGRKFPLTFRIPAWCTGASVTVNGQPLEHVAAKGCLSLSRVWKDGDRVELTFPMEVRTSRWHESSVSVERGPLVYALGIEEEWVRKENDPANGFGRFYWEVLPKSPWNYALLEKEVNEAPGSMQVSTDAEKASAPYFWTRENAPVRIKVHAKRVPSWELYNAQAGPLPYSVMTWGPCPEGTPTEEIELIPYGCTRLRITEFPSTRE